MKERNLPASCPPNTTRQKIDAWTAYKRKLLLEHTAAKPMAEAKPSDYALTWTEHNMWILSPRRGKDGRKVLFML